jgi:hypothetical protein
MKVFSFLIVYFLSAQLLQAQQPYPQGYFMYPVDKAQVAIVANFGELRPNHWHMGLDCRTNAQENFPILAAADGYISKVKIEPYGFGNAIYITHPNGFTTLYAHLNDFYPELQAYVKAQQYAQKSWKIFIDIPANKFPVKRGQFIAKSGNTGGSMGPHLHFEIRDTKTDKVLNPLRFGFPLPDNVKPTVTKLFIYDRNKSVFEQTPIAFALIKKGNDYFVKDTIRLKSDCVSFAISAYDQISGTSNQNGIFGATIFDNNEAVCGFRLDSIGYNETRFLNAHIDYKMKFNGGSYVQHLSALPGNSIAAYKNYNIQNGQIDFSDDKPHALNILVSDANNNNTNVYFTAIKAANAKSIKDSVIIPSSYFMAGQNNTYNKNGLKLSIGAEALYDRIALNVTEKPSTYSNVYNVHFINVPLHNNISIGIQPSVAIDAALQNKIVMLQTIKTTTEGFAATYNTDGFYYIKTRDFGIYKLAIDTTAPKITPSGFANNAVIKGGVLRFVIKDNFTAIKKADLYLDDEWILLGYKGDNFYYKVDEKLTPGTHTLKIVATDDVGNETVKTYTIKK